jgi:hypothetical protein
MNIQDMIEKRDFTTKELARVTGHKCPSVHRAYCVHGSFLGLKPRKLPNGRLLWPRAEVERILEAGN